MESNSRGLSRSTRRRTLDIRQANVADIDIVEQPGEIVINAFETRFQLTHTPPLPIFRPREGESRRT